MDLLNVFVSRPTWVDEKFAVGLDNFLTRIEDLGLKGRTIGVTDQPTKAPLEEVLDLLNECRGAVILGYPQITFSNGIIKNKKIENVQLATEWNHIEAGLAYAKGLPLLVIHHDGVIRGIFDRGALNSFIYKFDLSNDSWSLSDKMTGVLRKWRDQCLIRDEKERQNILNLEERKQHNEGANIIAKLICQPSFYGSGNSYKVRIENTGPEDAKIVNISFPNGNDPVIKSEYDSKLPIESLPAGIDYDLIASVTYDTSPPFKAEVTWEDNRGKHIKTFPLT